MVLDRYMKASLRKPKKKKKEKFVYERRNKRGQDNHITDHQLPDYSKYSAPCMYAVSLLYPTAVHSQLHVHSLTQYMLLCS